MGKRCSFKRALAECEREREAGAEWAFVLRGREYVVGVYDSIVVLNMEAVVADVLGKWKAVDDAVDVLRGCDGFGSDLLARHRGTV